jgi:competence protein ComEC
MPLPRVPALVVAALAFVAAAWVASGPSPPAVWALVAVAVAAVVAAPRARVAALAGLLGASAAARARSPPDGARLGASLPAAGARVVVEGEVVTSEPASTRGESLVVEVARGRAGGGAFPGPGRVSCFVVADPGSPPAEALPGDRVRLWGVASPIAPPTNPGAYDAVAAAERRGVVGRVDVPDPRGLEVVARGGGPLSAVAAARAAAARGLDAALSPDDAGLVRSLLLGDRGALSSDDRRRFREAGASHILAISGAHVALLVAALHLALRRLGMPPRPAAAVVLALVALFVPFTGSAPPVVRSAAGFALFLGGRVLGLEPSGGVLLAAVAAGFLTLDPTELDDPGFRMSFAAAAGMVLLATRFHRAMVPERAVAPGIPMRPRAPLRASVAAGLAAWLGSTPVAAADLGQVSWVAVPVGVVAVPASAFVMAVGGLAAALAPVPVLGPAARGATEGSLAFLRWFLDLPARAGLETTAAVAPDAAWTVAYVAALVAVARLRGAAAGAGAVAAALLLAALSVPAGREPPPFPRLTFLDVGHGQAALLETPDGQTALLDAGSRDRLDPAWRAVLPALRALGVESLSLACASHADADHAGALPEVLAAVPAATVVVPPRFPAALVARLAGTGAVPVVASDGDVLLSGRWGRLRVLGPARDPPWRSSTNDACLVLLLETEHGRVLLPGDRETPGVEALLAAHPGLRCETLVLPHHGHPSAGLDALVSRTGASLLVASCPASARAALPPGTRSTAEEGAFRIGLGPGGPRASRLPRGDERRAEYDPAPGARRRTMADPTTLLAAAAALLALAIVAARLRWLTRPGAAGAAVLGLAAVSAFRWAGLAALLAPFLAATLVGKAPGGLEAGPRTLRQVAANGAPALAGIALAWAGHPWAGALAFVGALAALGADTLATEVGTRWGGTPRSVLSWRALRRGESGGVTALGTSASVAGGALAPGAFLVAGGLAGDVRAAAATACAGVAAGLVDSLLGATVQRRGVCPSCGEPTEAGEHCGVPVPPGLGRLAWLDNDLVNLVAGFAGAGLALVARFLP